MTKPLVEVLVHRAWGVWSTAADHRLPRVMGSEEDIRLFVGSSAGQVVSRAPVAYPMDVLVLRYVGGPPDDVLDVRGEDFAVLTRDTEKRVGAASKLARAMGLLREALAELHDGQGQPTSADGPQRAVMGSVVEYESSIVKYIDAQLDAMATHPFTWGSSESLELQALLLLELRNVARQSATTQPGMIPSVRDRYFDFWGEHFGSYACIGMAGALTELGREEELPKYIAMMRERLST